MGELGKWNLRLERTDLRPWAIRRSVMPAPIIITLGSCFDMVLVGCSRALSLWRSVVCDQPSIRITHFSFTYLCTVK